MTKDIKKCQKICFAETAFVKIGLFFLRKSLATLDLKFAAKLFLKMVCELQTRTFQAQIIHKFSSIFQTCDYICDQRKQRNF